MKLRDGRNVGLMAMECRDVLFEDILRASIRAGGTCLSLPVDPIFAAVCEPGSLRITDVLTDIPVSGIKAELRPDLTLHLSMSPQPVEVRLVITLHGIRRSQAAARLRVWTPAQAARNTAFYAQFHAA